MSTQNEKREMEPVTQQASEINLKELVFSIKSWLQYLVSKWKILLVIAAVGAITGIARNKLKQKLYIAKCNFILDEGNKSGSPGIGGLALLGLGSAGGDGGLFQGKNLIWLYSSRLMLQKTLLEPVDSVQKGKTYLDWFLEIDKKGKEDYLPLAKKLKFSEGQLTREENSIISFAIGKINKDYLKVEQASDADNIIAVKVSAPDELFAESFANKIIEEVNEYYIKTKTQKINEEVTIIQQKVDSFQRQMNSSMYQAASTVDAIPNANPNRQVLTVPTRRKSVDVNISSELFVEMNKNLEAKRMVLASETPLIQVLEKPQLPLDTNGKSLVTSAITGAIIFIVLGLAVLVFIRIYRTALK